VVASLARESITPVLDANVGIGDIDAAQGLGCIKVLVLWMRQLGSYLLGSESPVQVSIKGGKLQDITFHDEQDTGDHGKECSRQDVVWDMDLATLLAHGLENQMANVDSRTNATPLQRLGTTRPPIVWQTFAREEIIHDLARHRIVVASVAKDQEHQPQLVRGDVLLYKRHRQTVLLAYDAPEGESVEVEVVSLGRIHHLVYEVNARLTVGLVSLLRRVNTRHSSAVGDRRGAYLVEVECEGLALGDAEECSVRKEVCKIRFQTIDMDERVG